MAFVLNPRLMADTAGIADWSLSRVLLMNDKRFPWIILVPRRPELAELFDLDESARGVLIADIARVGQHLKGWAKSRGGGDRINVAMIGNTAMRESKLDAQAKSRNSSASGLFQFIDQTWLGLVKQYGERYGLGSYAGAIQKNGNGQYVVTSDDTKRAILALRQDPELSAVM